MTIPTCHLGAPAIDVLEQLSETRRPRLYLQIGVGSGALLERIHADLAVGVDPAFAVETNVAQNKQEVRLEQTTSERFFDVHATGSLGGPVDFTVLSGPSDFAALTREFERAEALGTPRSLIAICDALPTDVAADRGETSAPWSDRWKIVSLLAAYRPDLALVCVDAAPNGLVFVTNLDPRSDVLRRRRDDIVQAFGPMRTDRASIEAMYRAHPIMPTASILNAWDQSLYFRT